MRPTLESCKFQVRRLFREIQLCGGFLLRRCGQKCIENPVRDFEDMLQKSVQFAPSDISWCYKVVAWLITANAPNIFETRHTCKTNFVMPAKNTSEHSFSALRRWKTYLKTTMTKNRLNNLMILHENEKSNAFDISVVVNKFVSAH